VDTLMSCKTINSCK